MVANGLMLIKCADLLIKRVDLSDTCCIHWVYLCVCVCVLICYDILVQGLRK